MKADSKHEKDRITAGTMVRRAGVRMTGQRRAVLEVLINSDDHPTASQIYERAKELRPGISLATVYNCLETMSRAGIINQLHFDTGSSRYCPNLHQHVHFLDEETHSVTDVLLKPGTKLEEVFDLPAGACIRDIEACLRGSLRTAIHISKEP